MIVDDSAVVRQTMKELLSSDPQLEVAATAADPLIAAKKMESFIPDVIVLDIEMPRMDGITFLRRLMNAHPIPVVICSGKSEAGSQNAIQALEYGAVEIIQKPKLGTRQFLEESRMMICDAVKAAALTKVKRQNIREPAKVQQRLTADAILPRGTVPLGIDTTEKVAVIGASTGGTEALREFIEQLPADAPGMVIVQHMPENFTAAFAKRLDGLARVSVKEAENNDSILRGHILIAPGNRHILLKRSGARYFVEVREGPLVSRHRPSVDVLFRSAARYAGKNVIGVIMTGMGDDGARGMAEMHEAGAFTIAQDEKSCVVFGMPNEAIKRGGVDEIISLENIASRVLEKGKRG
jgi:two-component system chemotaxis response regulator CheB